MVSGILLKDPTIEKVVGEVVAMVHREQSAMPNEQPPFSAKTIQNEGNDHAGLWGKFRMGLQDEA